jgi:hypothetical protein
MNSTSPCLQPALRSTRRAAAGATRLEFTLAVVVAGLIASLALHRIAQLQVFAQDASAQTTAAQTRSVSALAAARDPTFNTSAASRPRPSTPAQAPLTGAAP